MGQTVKEALRQESLCLHYRLKSIVHDAQFVESVCQYFAQFPIFPNERCGQWYVPLEKVKEGTVYFKSTDGHTGNWDFNMRRGNWRILPLIAKHSGCIIVDSTRSGKRFPDSLSKTIPLWCTVINRFVKMERLKRGDSMDKWQNIDLCTLEMSVSANERHQMTLLLPQFDQKIQKFKHLIMDRVMTLEKPLKPIWVHPESRLFMFGSPWEDVEALDFYPIILISASQRVADGCIRQDGYCYVQGSGDDEESWAKGLKPHQFWKFVTEFNACQDNEECMELLQTVTLDIMSSGSDFDWIGDTGLAIGNFKSALNRNNDALFDVFINCGIEEYTEGFPGAYLKLVIPEGKKGKHAFLASIPIVLLFTEPFIQEKKKILIFCKQGIDRSVGITMAILAKFFKTLNKDTFHELLLMIQSHRPQAQPTRATLKKLNEYYLSS